MGTRIIGLNFPCSCLFFVLQLGKLDACELVKATLGFFICRTGGNALVHNSVDAVATWLVYNERQERVLLTPHFQAGSAQTTKLAQLPRDVRVTPGVTPATDPIFNTGFP